MAYAAAAGAVGFAYGLILGGVVTDALGWRWVFGVTVPVVVVVLCDLALVLPPPDRIRERAQGGIACVA